MRKSWLPIVAMVVAASSAMADDALPVQAAGALRRAVIFFTQKVASHGGYVYRYSADLAKREGEGKTGPDTVWVQPPGTPAVGMAYLDAYERTGNAYLLDAAKAAGECLIQGQLRSGAWNASIEFAPEARKKVAYRVDPPPKKRAFNRSTFDDDKSQSAIRFLSRLDKALDPTSVRASAHVAAMDAARPGRARGRWDAPRTPKPMRPGARTLRTRCCQKNSR